MTERITCPVFEHAFRGEPNGQTRGGQGAVLSKDRTFSYQQLEDAIELAVEHLKRLGVKPRERVAIISPSTIEYIIALFALWRQGAVACLLSMRLPEEGARACLQNISCARTIAPAEIPIPGTRTFLEVRVPGNDAGNEYAVNAPADIMFTSGSSGEPKAVAHSFGNHYFSALAANEHIAVSSGGRWLLSLPLYHVGGLGILWRTFLAGGTVVVPDSSTDLADSLRKFNITHVSLVPTQLHRLLNDPKNIGVLQKMKAILIGGSAIPDVLIRKAIDARLPIHVSYGLTEMASQVATSGRLTKENPLPRGRILKYSGARVSDEHEILVKGKTLFQGYVTTATPGVAVVIPDLDKEGWFHTGDLGCLNEDGTLTVLGRKDNMFISGGENIQPEEIERHLCHIEGIVRAVVVPVRSEEFGARPVAFVQTKEGIKLSRTQILSSLRECLPSFKLPDQIYSWPATSPQDLKADRSYFLRLIKDFSSLKVI
ncbi:MAG: o-succinylbenzoate--CoA ligase [Candidatus Omnitrophica bacterium]|nr:o-succinylbenzoate--CoA ligase [Candidatus Omnitrophota bacterium]